MFQYFGHQIPGTGRGSVWTYKMLDPDPHFKTNADPHHHGLRLGMGSGQATENASLIAILELSVYALCVYQLMVAEGWGERRCAVF